MEPTQMLDVTFHEAESSKDATFSEGRVSHGTTQTGSHQTRGHHFEAFRIRDNARVHAGDVYSGQHNHYHGAPPLNQRAKKISLLDALAFEQMDFRYATVAPAHSKTCDWLFSASAYQRWRNQGLASEHTGFLWIKGKPGAGKSTLMKHAWEHAQVAYGDEKTISFFFNARGAALGKSVEGMYRCLLHQMLDRIPHLSHLEGKVSNADRTAYLSKGWPVAVLQDLFRQAVLHLCRRFKMSCYIDALDEGEDEDQVRGMVDFFYELAQRAVSDTLRFSVCFASRYYPKISVSSCEELRIEDYGGHGADISRYVHNKLRLGGGQFKQRLASEINLRSRGVFLWVVLVVAILNKENDRGNQHLLLARLQEIPNDLLQLFQDLRSRDSSDNRFLPAIEWVLHALSPLGPQDLYIAILASTGELTAERLASIHHTIDAGMVDDFVISSSKGFLEISSTSPGGRRFPKVQFIHETVREYFLVAAEFGNQWLEMERAQMRRNPTSKFHDIEPLASTTRVVVQTPVGAGSPHGSASIEEATAISHARLSQICQMYIRISHASDLQWTSQPRYTSLRWTELLERPFLSYSLEKVLIHAIAASKSGWLVSNLAEKFPWDEWVYYKPAMSHYVYQDNHAYYRMDTWLQRMVYERHPELVNDELSSIYANAKRSQQGVVEPAQSLLDACASGVGSALHIAASGGGSDPRGLTCLELLLNSGADVNKTCKDVGTPLHLAVVAEFPRMNAVRLLLKHGAHPNAKDHHGNSPLHYAILAQDFDLVATLVGHGADYNGRIGTHGNAAQTAERLGDWRFKERLAGLCANFG